LVHTPAPRAKPLDAVIVDTLVATIDLLTRAQSSPLTRELRAQAYSYEQAVKHWSTVPPHAAQLDAMLDLVAELHARAAAMAPEARGPHRHRAPPGGVRRSEHTTPPLGMRGRKTLH
jgi:hypothetical protein